MKKFISYFSYALSVLMVFSVASCSSDDIFEDMDLTDDKKEAKTCELVLNVEKISFDDKNTTRSATRSVTNWENGDKIYLTFSTSSGASYGDAIYNNGSWTVSYYGTLTEGIASKCTAVYFDNPTNAGSTVVQIDQHTGIYEDTDGLYVYKDGTLSVTAQLSPKTGRIRFAGNDKDSITVYGITHYTSYDASTCKFTTIDVAIKEGVSTDYTQYVYGFFTDTIQPRLNIITATSGYNRIFPKNVYKTAESGFLTIPSETSHIGWQQSVILKVNGVEFTMIPVPGYSEGFFLLAETETTEQLYNAITGATASTSQLPKTNMNHGTYILNLQYATELNFYIPSMEEWQYACKGGNKSKGYRYSGSNIISDVAWYSGNSGGYVHEVKQLQPNELGFYDMSGNVFEYTSTRRPSYSYNYYCGGYYYSSESDCKNTSLDYQVDSKGGLRVALKP